MKFITSHFDSELSRMLLSNVIVVGICFIFWWISTGAYQVSLPFDEIDNLKDEYQRRTSHGYRINLVLKEEHIKPEFIDQIHPESERIIMNFDSFLRENDNHTKFEIDAFLSSELARFDKENIFSVIIGCSEQDPESSDDVPEISMGIGRYTWVTNCQCSTFDSITELLKSVESILKVDEDSNYSSIEVDQWIEKLRISFTLVNTDPFTKLVTWDFETIEKQFLSPSFIPQLRQVYPNIKIDSQLLQEGSLPKKPKKIIRKQEIGGNINVLGINQMKYLLNNNPQWTLESTEESQEELTLHFIVYIPKEEETPFRISLYEENEISDLVNGYVIPKWGGVVFLNLPITKKKKKSKRKDKDDESQKKKIIVLKPSDLENEMKTLFGQLRMLLGLPCERRSPSQPGLPNRPPNNNNERASQVPSLTCPFESVGIADWEVDLLMRRKTFQHLSKATESLKALGEIAQTMQSINIQESVRDHVMKSLSAINLCSEHVDQEMYSKAYQFSRKAIRNSERAFYHPSIDSIMYFSLYQRFAVYLPLILSGYNILRSMIQFIKWRRKVNKIDQEEKILKKKET